jgi:hypothetical protein
VTTRVLAGREIFHAQRSRRRRDPSFGESSILLRVATPSRQPSASTWTATPSSPRPARRYRGRFYPLRHRRSRGLHDIRPPRIDILVGPTMIIDGSRVASDDFGTSSHGQGLRPTGSPRNGGDGSRRYRRCRRAALSGGNGALNCWPRIRALFSTTATSSRRPGRSGSIRPGHHGTGGKLDDQVFVWCAHHPRAATDTGARGRRLTRTRQDLYRSYVSPRPDLVTQPL